MSQAPAAVRCSSTIDGRPNCDEVATVDMRLILNTSAGRKPTRWWPQCELHANRLIAVIGDMDMQARPR